MRCPRRTARLSWLASACCRCIGDDTSRHTRTSTTSGAVRTPHCQTELCAIPSREQENLKKAQCVPEAVDSARALWLNHDCKGSAGALVPPSALPNDDSVSVNRPHTMKWDVPDDAVLVLEGEHSWSNWIHPRGFERYELLPTCDAVPVPECARTLAKLGIPLDAVEQIVNHTRCRHAQALMTRRADLTRTTASCRRVADLFDRTGLFPLRRLWHREVWTAAKSSGFSPRFLPRRSVANGRP